MRQTTVHHGTRRARYFALEWMQPLETKTRRKDKIKAAPSARHIPSTSVAENALS